MSNTALNEEVDLPEVTQRVPVGSEIYNQVVEHLYDEASLLDTLDLRVWQKSFTEDILYQAPVQITRRKSEKQPKKRGMMHLFENYFSMDLRIHKIHDTAVCWAEEPRSRTRRLITNIRVWATKTEGEYAVQSYFMVPRNRFEANDYQLLSGERNDRLRLVDGQWKLARREIVLDMAVLSMPNLAIFL
jgi:3-phenylpropionate/cinnamic acid dioxygenase small subunit